MTTIRLLFAAFAVCLSLGAAAEAPLLSVSPNGRSLQANDETFFWLGDTGWLLLSRLGRTETEHYLQTRKDQGFNVIQVMVLHTEKASASNGVPALIDGDVARPNVTPGNDPALAAEYDYWDHLDWVATRCEELGIYLALVPVWGTVVVEGHVDPEKATVFARFLAERYRDQPNIVWLNGGDTWGNTNTETWSALGRTLKQYDPEHLMTFHPIGRTDSSWWFHQASWLDFNMYQSGHMSYAQDPDGRGEDTWSYAEEDWARRPAKPFIDGEPSYESIPHGLHGRDAPRWQAADARRYAWWAVLSGAFGHTYGENNVMQMYAPGDRPPAFHADLPWQEALHLPGAWQMQYLKALMQSHDFDRREPDASLIVDNGQQYDRIPVLRGPDYLLAYTYTGRPFTIRLGVIYGTKVSASWYSPRDGEWISFGTLQNEGEARFIPPGDQAPGNDWVLVLEASPVVPAAGMNSGA